MKHLTILLGCFALTAPAHSEKIDFDTVERQFEAGQRKDAERDAFELADDICLQNFESLEARFAPELWAKSQKELREAPKHCPERGTKMELVAVDTDGRDDRAGIFARETYVVLAHDRSKWTLFRFVFQSSKKAAWEVEAWEVRQSKDKPDVNPQERLEREMLATLGWVAGGMLLFGAIAVVGLLLFFRGEHHKAMRRN